MILNICLDFSKRNPDGVTLEKYDGEVVASDYCDDIEDFVAFAREHASDIDTIAIIADLEDIGDTAVLEFGCEVAREIRKELEKDGRFDED